MPVSHRYRCLFVHIPKTGGTSIERALGMFADWRVENPDLMFGRIRSAPMLARGFLSGFLQHLTLGELKSLLAVEVADGYFSFATVRNPWDRMVSTFCKPDPHLVCKAGEAGVELLGLNFPQFVRTVASIDHIHLLEQHKFVSDIRGRILVDHLIRFESLPAGFAAVCRRLGCEAELGHFNRSDRDGYRPYYDEESRRIVEKRYRRDIELFGYEF